MEDLEWTELVSVSEMVRHGVRVTMLPMFATEFEPSTTITYTPMLRNLFVSTPQTNYSRSGTAIVDLVATMSPDTASGVLSAILDSQSIREMTLVLSAERIAYVAPDSKVWVWLALRVFSRHATNQLDCLTIDLQGLSHRHVAGMASLLSEPNPLASFFDNPLQTDEFTLDATTFCLSEVAGKGPELTLGTEAVTVRVVDDRLEDWIGVLLPGYGRAWVARSQCQLVPVRVSTYRNGYCRAIREVTLRSVDVDSRALASAFLRVVGEGVNRLSLKGKDTTRVKIANDWYAEILRLCPALDALAIEGVPIESVDTFCEAMEIGQIRELSLHLVKPATRLANLSVHVAIPNDTLAELQDALHRMFARNHYLQDVTIAVYDTVAHPPPSLVDRSISRKYDGEFVRGRGGPLLLSTKCAFLSVVTPTSLLSREKRPRPRDGHRGVLRVLQQLDQRVLALIFEFAAQSKTRRVNVRLKMG